MAVEDYRHLFEAHPSPMLIYEVESLVVLAVNDALCEELGYGRDELVGESLLKLHSQQDHDDVTAIVGPLRDGRVQGFRRVGKGLRQRRKDGTFIDVEALGQPIDFASKSARLVMLRDVGAERRARLLEERYTLLFERSREIILVIAGDGRILDANPAAVRAYGYWKEDLLRLKISELREPATVPEVRRQMDRALHGVLFQTVHRRKDGTCFPVEVNSSGIELDGEKVLLSIIRDISDRHGLNSEVQRQLDALALELELRPGAAREVAAKLRRLL